MKNIQPSHLIVQMKTARAWFTPNGITNSGHRREPFLFLTWVLLHIIHHLSPLLANAPQFVPPPLPGHLPLPALGGRCHSGGMTTPLRELATTMMPASLAVDTVAVLGQDPILHSGFLVFSSFLFMVQLPSLVPFLTSHSLLTPLLHNCCSHITEDLRIVKSKWTHFSELILP